MTAHNLKVGGSNPLPAGVAYFREDFRELSGPLIVRFFF
jgi:hypothetical protein